jgi:hypothetical protein
LSAFSEALVVALLFLGVWGMLTYGVATNLRNRTWLSVVRWSAFTFVLTAFVFALAILRTRAFR